MRKPVRPWLIGTGPATTLPPRSSQAWFVESRTQARAVGAHGNLGSGGSGRRRRGRGGGGTEQGADEGDRQHEGAKDRHLIMVAALALFSTAVNRAVRHIAP